MLTLEFVVLSLFVYLCLSALGLLLVYVDLTKSLDEELKEVLAVTRKLVLYNGKSPYLTFNPAHYHTVHLRMAVQLWGADRHNCTSYGVAGPEMLMNRPSEIRWGGQTWRCLARPIEQAGQITGYLQVEAPTADRDLAISKLLEKSLLMAPILLLGLAACGYAFSGRAIKPVEHTYGLQKRFLADAGHELKTPLSIMLVALDNLTKDFAEHQPSVDRIDKVRRSARRMHKLIHDLILLTKTEQYSEPLETSTIQLDMLLREVMGEVEDLFEDKDVTLSSSKLESVQITGNRDSIYTIFSNLTKNAMQHTNSGGSVTVGLTKMGESAIVSIIDTGVGISTADLAKIFERFYRAESSRANTKEGSGLGLAIVKAMIDRHYGSVRVTSEVGKGTTFTITLPIAQARS